MYWPKMKIASLEAGKKDIYGCKRIKKIVAKLVGSLIWIDFTIDILFSDKCNSNNEGDDEEKEVRRINL